LPLTEGLIGFREVLYIANRAIAVRQAGKRIFEKSEQRETSNEAASCVRQRLRGSDTHGARLCRGRRGRHAGTSLGQERVQFRRDAVRSPAVAEFEPASGRQSQCRPTGRRLSQSDSHAASRGGGEAKG